ncbi:MAG: hypothetical protein JNM51_12790 [Bacteroidia bacterium]|nr:hypothetical protein [Bacteroidia bacterium]
MTNIHKYDIITFDELISFIENDKTDNNFRTAADNLLEALTDWPTEELNEPKDIILELKKHIKDNLTFDNIEKYSKTLTVTNDAWKIEALHSIIEMFDFNRNNNFDKEIQFEQIIDKITTYYRNNI